MTRPHRAAQGRLIHTTWTQRWRRSSSLRPSRDYWSAGGVTESRSLSESKSPQTQQMLYWGGSRETRWAQQEITVSAVKYLTCEQEERAIAPGFCPSEAVRFSSGVIWQWTFIVVIDIWRNFPCFEMRSPANCTRNEIQSFCSQQAVRLLSLHSFFLLLSLNPSSRLHLTCQFCSNWAFLIKLLNPNFFSSLQQSPPPSLLPPSYFF